MGADYSFYVKSIATYAPAFLRHNNSVLARVYIDQHHAFADSIFSVIALAFKIDFFDLLLSANFF